MYLLNIRDFIDQFVMLVLFPTSNISYSYDIAIKLSSDDNNFAILSRKNDDCVVIIQAMCNVLYIIC
jgi:hypothetical protein